MFARTVTCALLVAATGACKKAEEPPDAPAELCTDTMPLAPTFANVQRLMGGRCTTCHTTTVELDLTSGVAYTNLVDRPPPSYADPPTDESCGIVLVKPGDPLGSYLYQKVSSPQPCAGSQMPRTDIGTSSPLVACAQQLIFDWIAAGAPP